MCIKSQRTTTTRVGRPKRFVSPEERDEIIRLSEFYGTRKLAERFCVGRRVIRGILDEAGRSVVERQSKRESILGPDILAIEERVDKGISITRILREIGERGYSGGRTILAAYVRRYKKRLGMKRPTKVKRRFETKPGLESQLDWSPYTVDIAGKPTKVHALGVLLCHSRKVHYGVYRDERQSTLLEGMAIAGDYFEGFTRWVVIDNMATAVLGRIGSNGKPIWHPRFKAFCEHCGFTAKNCRVNDPDRKGKKEKSFRLFFDDFLKGKSFSSWSDLLRQLAHWLDHTPGTCNLRRHGTTGLVPNDVYLAERPLLIPLPSQRFPVYEETTRLVDDDATISVHQISYNVPDDLVGLTVPVRLYAEHFEVLNKERLVVYSCRYIDKLVDPRRLVIDESCYANTPRRARDGGSGQRLDEIFVRRFPQLEKFVVGLKLKFSAMANIHVRDLLRLSSQYGEQAFLAAALKAQAKRRFLSSSVRRILEMDCPLPPEDYSMPLGGLGSVIVGDVDEANLDAAFGDLDKVPTTTNEGDGDGEE